ncbi:phage integrase N-terminal SAM-like domain-containing protein [Candidatus Halocynthiibacter alkanivorans]|uniref:phage integrase N-terminal SAM-like domain-containing protein n=1 Tax=Candidatus Halocynthiibacter alkanivorans TaxID=2267619 RepID=UPI000DF44D17
MIAHLVSIRDFEQFLEGKPFEKVTPRNAGAYRDRLVEFGRMPKKDGGLSNSTIRHRASHLSAFFKWLRNQDGFRRLSGTGPLSTLPFEIGRRSVDMATTVQYLR